MIITDYPWYLVLLCLLAGAAYAAVLYLIGRKKHFTKRLRWILASLRFIAVSLIAFLLLAPMTKRTVHERQQPHIVLATDRSLSVTHSADSTFTLEGIDGNYRFSRVEFGNENMTDIGSLLESFVGSDADAIVLATDGIYNRGANPTTVAERLTMPIYTIALGDTTPQRDATIADLRTNRVAMLGASLPIRLTISAMLLDGSNAQLSIADQRGKTLFSQRIAYNGNNFSQSVETTLPLNEAGLQRFTVSLSTVRNESNLENNRQTFFVDVIDTRRRVAIVGNAPHPDLSALRQAINNNPNYEAEVITENIDRTIAEGDYSLVILHNLPSATHPDIRFAEKLPQLYIIGLQTDLPRFNALHTGLEITARTKKTNEVTALFRPEFQLFSIQADDAANIEQLPPLSAPFGEARLSEGVQTLFNARLGNIDTRQPLIAASAQGPQHRAFVWGEGLWRWRLVNYAIAGSNDNFDRLIQQIISFSAMQDDRSRLRVDAERTYPAGLPIVVRAQLYNEAYQLTNTPDVSLTLRGDSLSETSFNFHRDGDAYSLTLPDLKEGIYRYKAVSDDLSTEGTFAIEALGLERRNNVADHSLLQTISTITGGQMFKPDQLDQLQKKLAEIKPVIYTHTRYADLVGLPLMLVLIILLLALEWGIRKYNGEI